MLWKCYAGSVTEKEMTINELAGMTQRGLRDVETRLREDMKAGFQMVLEEMRGFREEMRIGLQTVRIEYAELRERVETLEADMRRVKEKVGI